MQIRRSLLAPAGVLVLALAFSAGRCPAQAAAGPHQLSIGVVNTTHILHVMKEIKKLEADSRTRQGALQQQGQQREMELQDLQKHRDSLKPGSPQYKEENRNLLKKRAEMEAWLQMSKLEEEQWYKESIKGVYDHIAEATEKVAQDQHIDLVIADAVPEIGPDLEKTTAERLQMLLAARAVLYSNKKADITEDVLAVVEQNFAQQNPQVGGPAPLPAPGPTGK